MHAVDSISYCFCLLQETRTTDPDICFAVKGSKYDRGSNPAITALDSTLVEVHTMPENWNLYYSLFKVGEHGEFRKIVTSNKYDTGSSPTIAALPESNMVVEMHNHGCNLYYSVGHLDGGVVNWGPKGVKYDTGDNPAVAVTKSNVVVEVHTDSGNLYYRVGRLDVARIQWQGSNGQKYDTGSKPSLWITDENRVIEIHEGRIIDKLYYSIGRLDPDNLTLTWLSTGNQYDCGRNVSVTVDLMGLVTEVHSGGVCNLYYRLGTLEENYIAWYGKGGTKYDTGYHASITYVPGTHGIIAECHSGGILNLYQTSMMLSNVELVDITYGTAVESIAEPFASAKTDFDNPGPTSLKQVWEFQQTYISTNTYSWETTMHVGVKASAQVGFHGAGASVDTEASVDFTTGELSTISKIFEWIISQTVDVPPEAGKVYYEATLYRKPAAIPFTATFKRGDIQWQESGEVAVSHGQIYAKISSVSP